MFCFINYERGLIPFIFNLCKKINAAKKIQLTANYQAKNSDWVWSDTNTEEVAKKIIYLLQNKEERNALAENQNTYAAKHFTSEAMYTAYNSFYRNILES